MIKKFAAAFAALALAAGAHASTVVYTGGDLPTAESVTTPASTTTGPAFTGSFSAPAGAGELTFTLIGYDTLDGQLYPYEDDFKLTFNGSTLFFGTFNLGGGGANAAYSTTPGLTATGADTNPGDVLRQGGSVTFTVPVTLLASNTIGFSYDSLDTNGYVGVQGLGDEGWSVADVKVTAVPEPGSLALMFAGLGIVGGLARRRRQA